MTLQQPGGAQFQGEDQRPLLALAAKIRRLIIEQQSRIVAVRPDARLPQPAVFLPRRLQSRREIFSPAAGIFDPQLLTGAADRMVRSFGLRLQFLEESRSRLSHSLARCQQRLVEGRDLPPARCH